MSAVTLLVRSLLRRRWRSYLAIAVLIGLGGSVALAAGAGARRTLSAYPAYLRRAKVSDLAVDYAVTHGRLPVGTITRIASVPQVLPGGSSTYVAMNLARLTPAGELDPTLQFESIASVDGRFLLQDRAVVLEGRLPRSDRADEVLVNSAMAQRGIRLGQVLHVATVPPDNNETGQSGYEMGVVLSRERLHVVGIGLLPEEVVQDDFDRFPRMVLTPPFTRAHAASANYPWQGLRLRAGTAGVADAKRSIARALGRPESLIFREQPAITAKVQRSVRPVAAAMGIFAAAVALALLALAGQAFSRQLSFEEGDERSLRALGLGAAGRALPMALPAGATLVAGAALAVLGAVALSPIAPVGTIRRVDPHPGPTLDATAVLGGAAAFVIVLGVVVAVLAVRAVRRANAPEARNRTSRLATAAGGLGAPASMGVRMALEPGHGPTAVPVRTNLFAVTAAVVVVMAALTFAASLSRLVARPAYYGAPWSGVIAADGGYGEMVLADMHKAMDDDSAVDGWSGVSFSALDIAGHNLPVMGIERGKSDVGPPVLHGRSPVSNNEILLAGGTADALHVGVGDRVTVSQSGGRRRQLTVVGTGVLPAIGQLLAEHVSPGNGAVLTANALRAYLPQQPLISSVLVRLGAGVPVRPGMERLARSLPRPEFASPYDVIIDQRPADIANSSSMGPGPATLAGLLAVAAVLSVVLTVAVSTRRRRNDLAVLKAIGFTRRQLSTAVAWQAGATMLIGVAVGTVLGVVTGRAVWRVFANQLHVVPDPTVPVVAVIAAAVALIVAANLVALPVGRAAGRTPAAVTLRTE